jgi:hypothetical protein
MSPASVAEPSVGKAVSLVNADRNGEGTFPSGGEVNFDVTPSCSFTTDGPPDCNSFDLRDTIPGCLKHQTPYDEHTAWAHRTQLAA